MGRDHRGFAARRDLGRSSTPDGPGAEAIEQARSLAGQRLGSAVAAKGTDAFCLAYAGAAATGAFTARPVFPAGAEAASPPGAEPQPALIELQEPADEIAPPSADLAVRALGGADPDEKIASALEALGKDVGPAERALALISREYAIRAERDRFYHRIGGLRDEIERTSAALALDAAARPRLGIAAAPVQACWLNGTIRADTDASVLADIAGEDAVERIDVPRRIEPEDLDVTIQSAASLRAKANLSGSGVHVGVIDSEVQLDHPALSGRVVHRRNYTQEPFGVPGDHGTAVAGLIAASSDAFTGIAPAAEIYNYKVLATQSALDGTDFEAYLAIQHALEDGVRVVNCSWGSGPAGDGSGREARACDKAWALGMAIVKSAGNRGPGDGTLTAPADADGIIVVGASTADGSSVPDYSSRGPTPDGKQRPHVLAPGGDFGAEIDGIVLGGGAGPLPGPGTSFAAPHVTGLLALLIERDPGLAPDQLRDRVVASCKPLPGVAGNAQGAGLVTPTTL